MIITSVERKRGRRNRVEVYVDGLPLFDLARDVAATRELRPGRPIEPAEIEAMVEADARRGALDTAVAMLARRPRSEREIRRRLAQRRCAAALVDETIGRLRAMKLIDDAEFARAWIETRDRISRLLVGELRALGVEANIARDAAAEVPEADAAYRVASKRVRLLSTADYRSFRDRLSSHLQRRGFSWDVVSSTVQQCWRERAGDDGSDDLTDTIE